MQINTDQTVPKVNNPVCNIVQENTGGRVRRCVNFFFLESLGLVKMAVSSEHDDVGGRER